MAVTRERARRELRSSLRLLLGAGSRTAALALFVCCVWCVCHLAGLLACPPPPLFPNTEDVFPRPGISEVLSSRPIPGTTARTNQRTGSIADVERKAATKNCASLSEWSSCKIWKSKSSIIVDNIHIYLYFEVYIYTYIKVEFFSCDRHDSSALSRLTITLGVPL